jgi:hypothetical protein
MEDTSEDDVSPDCSSPFQILGGPALKLSEIRTPGLLHPVNDPCELAVTWIASKAIHSYECSTISQLQLTDPLEVEEAIRVLKIDKVVGPSGPNIPETSMKA